MSLEDVDNESMGYGGEAVGNIPRPDNELMRMLNVAKRETGGLVAKSSSTIKSEELRKTLAEVDVLIEKAKENAAHSTHIVELLDLRLRVIREFSNFG